jgi:predicted PhzF superfamily epimerase YddE/YHI9
VVRAYMPRGGIGNCGHVLITSRRMTDEWRSRCVLVDCFDLQTSINFPQRAATPPTPAGSASAAPAVQDQEHIRQLAELLGCLPLALAMAAAYMQRCDVGFRDYAVRLENEQRYEHASLTAVALEIRL